MNISSSFNSPLSSGINNKPATSIKSSVRSVEPAVVSDIEQELSSNNQAKPSIIIDEQAIALFEKNQVEKNQTEQNQASFSTPEQSSKQSFAPASQDQPSAKNESAVANYQAVGNLAQRESVQQLFGVDLFA